MLEREVKLSFPTADAARAAVVATGAKPLRARRLQDDALFDTADEWLRKRGCALRVRIDAGTSVLTFKGPVQPGAMKIREEHETAVADGDALRHVLQALGLHVWFRYQKYREEFAGRDVTLTIDETPIGTFVELEGGDQGITDAATALGLGPPDFILDSYRSLFLRRREAYGMTGNDMLFPAG